MSVDFPISTKVISLGRVANPVIPLLVLTQRGYAPFDFLIDTGADCSMIPSAIAQAELGLDLTLCPQEVFFGTSPSRLTTTAISSDSPDSPGNPTLGRSLLSPKVSYVKYI